MSRKWAWITFGFGWALFATAFVLRPPRAPGPQPAFSWTLALMLAGGILGMLGLRQVVYSLRELRVHVPTWLGLLILLGILLLFLAYVAYQGLSGG
jgi:hypothetical protein